MTDTDRHQRARDPPIPAPTQEPYPHADPRQDVAEARHEQATERPTRRALARCASDRHGRRFGDIEEAAAWDADPTSPPKVHLRILNGASRRPPGGGDARPGGPRRAGQQPPRLGPGRRRLDRRPRARHPASPPDASTSASPVPGVVPTGTTCRRLATDRHRPRRLGITCRTSGPRDSSLPRGIATIRDGHPSPADGWSDAIAASPVKLADWLRGVASRPEYYGGNPARRAVIPDDPLGVQWHTRRIRLQPATTAPTWAQRA